MKYQNGMLSDWYVCDGTDLELENAITNAGYKMIVTVTPNSETRLIFWS